MKSDATKVKCAAPGPPTGDPGALRRWGLLMAWLAFLWVVVFLVAPLGRHIGPVRLLTDFIRSHDIDAAAYYYTEVEEFGIAEHIVRDTMTYAHDERP